MPRIERYTDFQNGAMSDAEQLDNELNRIHDLVNGGLDKDNIFPDGIESGNIRNLDGNKIIDSTLSKQKLNTALTAELDEKETIANSDAKLALKRDKSDSYSKTETDNLLSAQNTSIHQDMNNALDLKRDKSDSYSKTETDNLLDLKADKTDTYTKGEVDGLMNDVSMNTSTALSSKFDKVGGELEGSIHQVGQDMYDIYATTNQGTEGGIFLGDGNIDLWWKDKYIRIQDSGIELNDGTDIGKIATENDLHTHTNKATLDKLSDDGTYLKFDGVIVGGGSGGGSVVQDSATNGHILIDGVDTTVYDDSSVMTTLSQKADASMLSQKADASSVYTKTEADNKFQPVIKTYATRSLLPTPVNSDLVYITDEKVLSKGVPAVGNDTNILPLMTGYTDSATGYVVSASTEFSTAYPAWKIANRSVANDGGDQWSSNRQPTTAQPEWVKWKFGTTPKTITKVRLQARNNNTLTSMPKDFQFQVSSDDVNWTTVFNAASIISWTNSGWKEYSIPADSQVEGLYFRILITANNGNAVVQIGEMELYNNPPARYDDINRPKTTTKYLSPDQAIPDSTYTQVNGLTYTATRDGQIEVYLSLNYTTLTATSTASKSVFGRVGLNGNWNDPKYYVLIDYALAATHTISGRKTIDVKKGDVVSVWGYATGGGNLATNWTYAEFREL